MVLQLAWPYFFSCLPTAVRRGGKKGFGVSQSGDGGSSSGTSRVWVNPSSLADNFSIDGFSVNESDVAIDDNGNAIVVWSQNDGTNNQVFKAEYRNGAWTVPANINDNISPDGQNVDNPHVAMDDNGNAIIVWDESDGSDTQVFKSEYRSGSWTHPANLADNISPDGSIARNAQVAMDDNGNAIIVWQQVDATFQIFKSEYRVGAWTHPANAADNISPDGSIADEPVVAMGNNGDAIIVWKQDSGGFRDQVYKSDYRAGVWTNPANVADYISMNTSDVPAPKVAMDNSGNTIVVWSEDDGNGDDQVFKSEYRSGAWTHPAGVADNISPDGFNTTGADVAMSDNGTAVIVWGQWDGNSDNIYRSNYVSGAWTSTTLAARINFDDWAYEPKAAMDSFGNAVMTWYQYGTGDGHIYKSEYRSGAWVDPTALADKISFTGGDSEDSHVAMSSSGDAIIGWMQNDGANRQAFASLYK